MQLRTTHAMILCHRRKTLYCPMITKHFKNKKRRACGVHAAYAQRRKYEWTTHVIIDYDMRMRNILTNYPGIRAAYVRRTCVLSAGAYKTQRKHSLRKHTHSVRTTDAQRTCGELAAPVRRTCGVRACGEHIQKAT